MKKSLRSIAIEASPEASIRNATSEQCGVCYGQDFRHCFQKKSENGTIFNIVICRSCQTMQTLPRPTAEQLAQCYQGSYFEQRTDRGYSDYRSEAVRMQIERVFAMNLKDLGFFEVESSLLRAGGRSLDVGCAAGYFVDFMQRRGWSASGVEISAPMAAHARSQGLDVVQADFLAGEVAASYDLVTLWASLEHFADPRLLLRRLADAVRPGGSLILSTCRRGLLSWLTGPSWRYMNVPEHLFFFSRRGLVQLFGEYGFTAIKQITYGSGLTTRPGASWPYRAAKRLADPLVKMTGQGDMMALHFRKR
ncbi:class I SAM-dependent methyltransferase [Leptonema illini]|uniref:class I SAM-dependent methyltransferase n=1 Tax=Leptonema illini TaxID=183 RepID=UPI00117BB661|nr:class I SAM-dependent methyltransferase [Leptonema illini]